MPRVLVVEDDAIAGPAVCRTLRATGLQPTLVASFDAARQEFAASAWDACVTDLSLPNSDGLAVVALARAHGVPVIVFTGHDDSALAHEARERGASDFFTKPEGIAHLAHAVWRDIRKQEAPMSDDPNSTVSPSQARKAGALARLSGATRQQAAIVAQRKAKAAETPVKAFFIGLGRKIGGLGIAWWGTTRLEAASKVAGADKYVSLALGALAIVIGLMALMPDITMTVLRFFGLGGLVDKVLKRKSEEPTA